MKLLVGALNRDEVLFRHLLWIFWKLNCVDSSRPQPAQCQYKHGMNITMWPSQPVANQTSYAENCLQSTVQSNESGKVFDFYSVVKNKNMFSQKNNYFTLHNILVWKEPLLNTHGWCKHLSSELTWGHCNQRSLLSLVTLAPWMLYNTASPISVPMSRCTA